MLHHRPRKALLEPCRWALLSFISSAAALALGATGAQSDQVEETLLPALGSWFEDLGLVGDPSRIEHSFVLINASDHPVRIARIVTGCTCEVAGFSEEQILPGVSTTIHAVISPARSEASFYSEFRIQLAGEPQQDLIYTLAGQLPRTWSAYLPVQVDLGSASQEARFSQVLVCPHAAPRVLSQWPKPVDAQIASTGESLRFEWKYAGPPTVRSDGALERRLDLRVSAGADSRAIDPRLPLLMRYAVGAESNAKPTSEATEFESYVSLSQGPARESERVFLGIAYQDRPSRGRLFFKIPRVAAADPLSVRVTCRDTSTKDTVAGLRVSAQGFALHRREGTTDILEMQYVMDVDSRVSAGIKNLELELTVRTQDAAVTGDPLTTVLLVRQ